MGDLERLSERLIEDERWRRDLTTEDATPLLEAGLALLEAALAVYTPDDPAGEPYQAPYREAAAGLTREALTLAARAITAPDEAKLIIQHGLRPLYDALRIPQAVEYAERVDQLSDSLPDKPALTGTRLARLLSPTSRVPGVTS